MKRITLAMMVFAAAAFAAPVVAQDPTPPARPARPAPAPSPAPSPSPAASPAPSPAPAPKAAPAAAVGWETFGYIDSERFRQEAQRMQMDMELYAPRAADFEAMRIDSKALTDAAREASRIATENFRFDADAMRDIQRDAARAASEMSYNFGDFMPTPAIAPLAPMAPMAAIPAIPAFAPQPFNAWMSEGFTLRTPPAPWAQGDPADSVYRSARNALTNGDYGRAAKMFSDLAKNYPKSVYATDAPYFEATARYKIGTTEELKNAARVLEPLVAKINSGGTATQNVSNDARTLKPGMGFGRGMNDSDVATLYARINGVLAQRGDSDAAAKVAKAAQQSGGAACDQEENQVKIEALNALSRMDGAQATPLLKRALDRKDECSAAVRRNAVFMLSQHSDAESSALLISIAKSDPNMSVRQQAIESLTRLPGDTGLNALEDILRTDPDERVQRQVVGALMRSDNAKARISMRALIDRKDAPINLRIEAIQSFNSDRATAEDGAYLRGLFAKADNDNLKRAVIDAVSRVGGTDNEQWLLTLAKNQNESSQVRGEAIGRMMRSSISIAEVGKLYDAADSYNMRSQIIGVLGNRKEPEATDKLVDIVKNSTDYKVRMQAINALGRRNDPRTQQLLTDLFDGKKP